MKKILFTIASVAVLNLGLYTYHAGAETSQAYNYNVDLVISHQQEQLDNHEARITNLESDVQGLQTNTNTQPSVQRVEVPQVNPQNQTPEPVPTPPVTITAFEQIPVGESQIDCRLTYSDSTSYTFTWKTWEYNQGTKITHTNGKCDQSVIGEQKS